MKRIACLLAMIAAPLAAQDFSKGSNARPWDLYAEQPALFEARVVDLLCHFTGDCPADCGAGTRQMGLLRTADNVLVLALKNRQAAFSGAAVDLAPYCGKQVEVDGLMLDDPDLGARNMYLVQSIREPGGEWQKANRFTREWAKAHPGAKGKGPWFRRDPRVNAIIAQEGYTGLGLDTDAAFIREWFE